MDVEELLELDERSKFRAALLSHMEPVAESYFDYLGRMLAMGWQALLPIWHETGSVFGFSEEEMEEMRFFEKRAVYRSITAWNFTEEARNEQQITLKKRLKYRETGDATELYDSGFGLTLEVMRTKKRKLFLQGFSEIKKLVREKRVLEFTDKLEDYSKGFSLDKEGHFYKMYKLILGEKLLPLGFVINKDLSSKNKTIFTKLILDDWLIVLSCESDRIIKKPPVKTNDGLCIGELNVNFGVIHLLSAQRVDMPAQNFVPVSNCLANNVYCQFHDDIQEFELLLLAHVDMYKIIEKDFELSLKNGITIANKLGLV